MAIGHSWAFFTDDQVVHMSCALYFSRFQVVGGIYAGMGFWDLNRKWYIYNTHPLDYSIVNKTFSQYCCSLLQIPGGIFTFWKYHIWILARHIPKFCNILPTCNRKVAISYLKLVGFSPGRSHAVEQLGSWDFWSVLIINFGISAASTDIVDFFWVLLPRKFNMVHMKMDQNGKGFHSGFGKPSFSGSMRVFEGVIMLYYSIYICIHICCIPN